MIGFNDLFYIHVSYCRSHLPFTTYISYFVATNELQKYKTPSRHAMASIFSFDFRKIRHIVVNVVSQPNGEIDAIPHLSSIGK